MPLDLALIAKGLPLQPGVYLFKDAHGTVVYVGKANVLRNRVRSYFAIDGDLKAAQIRERATDLECIVTTTEAEALHLENTLIKKHRPRFNIRLKDDKTYPYLKIDVREAWPRVYITRRMEEDGARYFGPYASSSSVRKTLDLVNKLFPYRSCTKVITGTDPRPCLDFHINRCLGPCIGAVSTSEYRNVIDQVILFLEGRQDVVIRGIRDKMWEAAKDEEYERAAFFRDQLSAIEKVTEEQKTVSTRLVDEDAIAFARAGNEAWAEVFFIRGGRLLGRDNFLLEGVYGETDGDVLASFIKQFYTSAPVIPPRILTQASVSDGPAISAWLQDRRGGARVQLLSPQRGDKKRLMEMVAENALHGLEALRVKVLAADDALQQAMEQLKDELNLPRLPRRIECYDISNTQGTNSVASMVVFLNGNPQRAHYRRFQIKTVEGADDYASMREVLRRRFKRSGALGSAAEAYAENPHEAAEAMAAFEHGGRSDHEADSDETLASEGLDVADVQPTPDKGRKPREDSFAVLPDLVLIDGGKGQLNAAAEVMRVELGLHHIPLASLAKQREELFVPEMPESVMLPRTSPALYLVQRARDEAHRFAITYHRNLRDKRGLESVMDIVPGVGPKRKRMLMRHFGSVQRIREATLDELAAVPGMTHKLAERVKEYV
ncbi:MAG: excinuclease ABC subunit UvrC [Chloroflexi bacterium]|nr:excinuclease ABC subunit UvrC [Chloroflexota bacterium]